MPSAIQNTMNKYKYQTIGASGNKLLSIGRIHFSSTLGPKHFSTNPANFLANNSTSCEHIDSKQKRYMCEKTQGKGTRGASSKN